MNRYATKHYSTKQEDTIANFLGWRRVAASGATDFHKGDVSSDKWLGECKTHVSIVDKLTFDYEVWRKISEEAHSHFQNPVLFVDDGSQSITKTWCMCELKRPDLFTQVQLNWEKGNKLNKSIIDLNAIYVASPYRFIVVSKGNEKLLIMPLTDFADYIETIK